MEGRAKWTLELEASLVFRRDPGQLGLHLDGGKEGGDSQRQRHNRKDEVKEGVKCLPFTYKFIMFIFIVIRVPATNNPLPQQINK